MEFIKSLATEAATILWHLFVAVEVVGLLWALYVCVMALKRERDKSGGLSGPARFYGYQALLFGLVLDVGCNVVIFTAIFLEPPRELTVTSRLGRHINEGGWRGKMARWLCSKMLDPFDPEGSHCG